MSNIGGVYAKNEINIGGQHFEYLYEKRAEHVFDWSDGAECDLQHYCDRYDLLFPECYFYSGDCD